MAAELECRAEYNRRWYLSNRTRVLARQHALKLQDPGRRARLQRVANCHAVRTHGKVA